MAPSSEFGMDKMNPAQKMNNKVDGTPKPESKKVKVQSPDDEILVAHWSFFPISFFPLFICPVEVKLLHHHQREDHSSV